jgi:hypothetical protein
MFQTLLAAAGVEGSHEKAVLKLVELTRKGGSKQAATMLGILSKIGKQIGASDPDGPTVPPGKILAEFMRQLSGEAPEAGAGLEEEEPAAKPEWIGEIEPERVIQMAVELGDMSAPVQKRLSEFIAGGDLRSLDGIIRGAPEGNAVTTAILEWIARPKNLQKLLGSEHLDLSVLDLLQPLVGAAAIGPMLDILVASEDEAARKVLIERLVPYGEPLGPLVLERIEDPRWEVRSDLLTILSRITPLPEGFTASNWYLDDDHRVRLQAMRFGLNRGENREKVLLAALRDPDKEISALGLEEVKKRCPEETAGQIIETALNGRETTGVRRTCIRAMAFLDAPDVLDALLTLTWQRRVFVFYILTPKSPEMLEALTVLATRFGTDPKVKPVLRAARKSKDTEIRAVVSGKGGTS